MPDPSFVFAQCLSGLTASMFLFLIASGLSLIFGVLRVLNFAHGTFYMLGAYCAYQVVQWLGAEGGRFWLAALGAALAVAALGAVEMAEEEALDQPAQDGHRGGGAEGGQPEPPAPVADPLHELEGRVGPEHVEGAVREVQHPQHAEDQRQPGGDEEQEHRRREAADRLREDEGKVRH